MTVDDLAPGLMKGSQITKVEKKINKAEYSSTNSNRINLESKPEHGLGGTGQVSIGMFYF